MKPIVKCNIYDVHIGVGGGQKNGNHDFDTFARARRVRAPPVVTFKREKFRRGGGEDRRACAATGVGAITDQETEDRGWAREAGLWHKLSPPSHYN